VLFGEVLISSRPLPADLLCSRVRRGVLRSGFPAAESGAENLERIARHPVVAIGTDLPVFAVPRAVVHQPEGSRLFPSTDYRPLAVGIVGPTSSLQLLRSLLGTVPIMQSIPGYALH